MNYSTSQGGGLARELTERKMYNCIYIIIEFKGQTLDPNVISCPLLLLPSAAQPGGRGSPEAAGGLREG